METKSSRCPGDPSTCLPHALDQSCWLSFKPLMAISRLVNGTSYNIRSCQFMFTLTWKDVLNNKRHATTSLTDLYIDQAGTVPHRPSRGNCAEARSDRLAAPRGSALCFPASRPRECRPFPAPTQHLCPSRLCSCRPPTATACSAEQAASDPSTSQRSLECPGPSVSAGTHAHQFLNRHMDMISVMLMHAGDAGGFSTSRHPRVFIVGLEHSPFKVFS